LSAEPLAVTTDPISPVEIRDEDVGAQVDWAAVFGADRPVEIDVGCGRGMYAIQAATARPDVNFLGIEIVSKPFKVACQRVERRALPNVRLYRGDAREFLSDKVPPASVSVLHVQFPDPWPKKRHHKRRVVNPQFVTSVAQALCEGGSFHIATDITDYFDELLVIIERSGVFKLAKEGGYDAEGEVVTNFAAKYREQGREMYDAWLTLATTKPKMSFDTTPF